MSDEIMVRILQRTVIDLVNVIRALNEENKKLRKENKKCKNRLKEDGGKQEKIQIPNCLGAYDVTDSVCFSCAFCECCKEYVDLERENGIISTSLKAKDRQNDELIKRCAELGSELYKAKTEIKALKEGNENKKGKGAKIKPWCEDCLIPSPCTGDCEKERVTAEELKKELTCFGEFEFKGVCLSCERGVLCKTYTEKNNE